MLIKCDAKCACQYDGYCIRKWQGLQCRDITHGKYQDTFADKKSSCNKLVLEVSNMQYGTE